MHALPPRIPSDTLFGPFPILTLEIPGHIVSGNLKTRFGVIPRKGKEGQQLVDGKGMPQFRAAAFSTKEAKEFEERVRSIATYAALRARWQMVDWCRVDIVLYNLRLDRGNASKTLEDALQGIVLKNDGHVLAGNIEKRKDAKGPRAILTVQGVNPADFGY